MLIFTLPYFLGLTFREFFKGDKLIKADGQGVS